MIAATFAVEWSQGIEDAWSNVATFVPKFLGFLVILIVGYFIAKLIAKAANAILERVGFDRAVERGGIKRALDRTKYDASDILGKIIFYALFLIVLQMAFGVFGPNPISDLLEGVIAYLPKVIAAILILVIAFAIAAAVRELIDATARRPELRPGPGQHRRRGDRRGRRLRRARPAADRTGHRHRPVLRAAGHRRRLRGDRYRRRRHLSDAGPVGTRPRQVRRREA